MSAEGMSDCPACGALVTGDARECAACGAVLEGATASFEPVATDVGPSEGAASEGPALIVRKGPEIGERFYIDRPELTLGRDPDRDIFLNDITVSREHALLRLDAGVVTVEDAGSLNGTYVNGVRVDRAPLGAGDLLQIGRFVMAFVPGGEGWNDGR